MISNLKKFCCILGLFVCSSALYLHIHQQPFCLTLKPLPSADYNIFYQSISEHSTLSAKLNCSNQTRYINQSITQIKISAQNTISLCLRTIDQLQAVSLDIYHSQQQQYRELALKSQVKQAHEELINIGLQLKQITHNEQFRQHRQVIQTKIIQNHYKYLFVYSIIKIGIVVIVLLGQLWILSKLIRAEKLKNILNF